MIIIPFGIIFTIIGFITYRMNLKAAREIELRRIENRISEIARRKAEPGQDEAERPGYRPRTRRVRSRR